MPCRVATGPTKSLPPFNYWLATMRSSSVLPPSRSPPALSSTSLAHPGQQPQQGQEGAMVRGLCLGGRGQGLQQSLTAPFADHVVNSPSSAWGREERLLTTSKAQSARSTQSFHGLQTTFECYERINICRTGCGSQDTWLVAAWWNHVLCCLLPQKSLPLQTHGLHKFFTVHWNVAERNKQRHWQVSKQQKAQWSFLRYWKLNKERTKAALGFCQMKRNPREALGRAFK